MRYEVNFTDATTGATSPIDVITAIEGYTAEDYIRDCNDNADDDWNEMLANGTVELTPIIEAVDILMADRCTKSEAEKLLANGSTVYDNIDEYIESLKARNLYNDETFDDIRSGKSTGVSAVTYAGHEYCIEYVL